MSEPNDLPQIRQPPLSIVHLMAWTMGTAFALVFAKFIQSLFGDMATPVRDLMTAQSIAGSFLQGASLAFLGIMVVRRFRGGAPLLVEPGHWILLRGAAATIGTMVTYAFAVLFQDFVGFQWLAIGTTQIPSLAILIFAMRARRSIRLWQVYFVVELLHILFFVALQFSLQFLSIRMFGNLSMVFQLLPILALCGAVLDDRLNKVKRDWIHWVGALLMIASIFLSTFLSMLSQYFS